MTRREEIIAGFLAATGWGEARRIRIAGDASNRTYDRLSQPGGETAILMDAPRAQGEDVRPFVRIAAHLRQAGLSAPQIYAQDAENGLLVIEDLGDALFAQLIAQDPARQEDLYAAACDVLLALRDVPPLDLIVCDETWLVSMIEPVFEWYASNNQTAAHQTFLAAFRPFARKVAAAGKTLSLRDYHAENLLLLPGRDGIAQVGLLDFQDAFVAHPAYDLVSILQDARRDVPPKIEQAMLASYLGRSGDDEGDFRQAYALLGLQRNLRILGIFARLGIRDGKPHYLDMIPRVWGYVQRNLQHPALQPLAPLLEACLPDPTPDHLNTLRHKCPTPLSQP